MGARGPKPTPAPLVMLKGNPGKRRLPASVNRPEPGGRPECPDDLDDEAKREWQRVIGDLDTLGLAKRLDRAALAGYCQAWSRWRDAEGKLKQFGAVIKSPTGYPMMSPYLSIANTALKQMREFLAEFGMSPAARTRVTTAEPPATVDPFDAFRNKRKKNA